jgi:hypothetical protein
MVMDSKKYTVKNGKIYSEKGVAVAISEGYGGGWSTWNGISPFDPEFNMLFLEKKYDEAVKLAEKKGIYYPDDIDSITVKWIKPGTNFIIREYDGNEYIEILDDIKFYTA